MFPSTVYPGLADVLLDCSSPLWSSFRSAAPRAQEGRVSTNSWNPLDGENLSERAVLIAIERIHPRRVDSNASRRTPNIPAMTLTEAS